MEVGTSVKAVAEMNADGTLADRVAASALWAAAGDAIGWITELADVERVLYRSGTRRVERPIAWKRNLGGRGSRLQVAFPAGTYSDDTQLRLAVCRAIRGDGTFDAEAFAKIELTVWQSYALGAGVGTKAAASGLARRDTNWFSNFFVTGGRDYLSSGGNGAAMRIQPHVWAGLGIGAEDVLLEVFKDAISTHGSFSGFAGAVFHAMALDFSLRRGVPATLDDILHFVRSLEIIPLLADRDVQLAAFWRPAYENVATRSLRDIVAREIDELLSLMSNVRLENRSHEYDYREILEKLGLFSQEFRGSGIRSAVAASLAVWIFRHQPLEVMLADIANTVGSDTDTIGTMAGAIAGSMSSVAPSWGIQDASYIEAEARRLAGISQGLSQTTFVYPDLAAWTPPSSQSEVVGLHGESFAVSGLGLAEPVSEEYQSGAFTWQWMRLWFGQTVFIKRRSELSLTVSAQQMPIVDRHVRHHISRPLAEREQQPRLPFNASVQRSRETQRRSLIEPVGRSGLDQITDLVIQSNFDDEVLGRAFNQCIEQFGSIEASIAFASIIAKAKMARLRRDRR
jgi:ADP-ribosylglycohydrolase